MLAGMDDPKRNNGKGDPRMAPIGDARGAVAPEPTWAGRVADTATDRLQTVAHELCNLVDGTMRYVALARQAMSRREGDPTGPDATIARQLTVAQQALARMARLVRDVMQPGARSLTASLSEPRPLCEAVMHACEVLAPLAQERNIRIDVEFSPRLVLAPAGPIYPVVSNAIRNAIEAIDHNGRVEVVVELVTPGSAATGEPEIQIDVMDDGPGPPPGAGDRVFDIGFTTKPFGPGVGLALSREIIRELGGWLSLTPRRPAGDGERRGGHLTVRYRLPQ